MAKIIEVPNNQCPIDRMVEIQNNGGLNGRFFLSEKCFEDLKLSADTVKLGGGDFYLRWDATDEVVETECVVKFPEKSSCMKPRYEIISITAEDIQFKRKKTPFSEYTILKREKESLSY